MKLTEIINFDNVVIIALTTVILGAFAGMLADNYFNSKRDVEFAKAGLVQKVEGYKVIWVKPEEKQ